MSRSTDPEMNAAMEADAAKLEAVGEDPGPELEDFDFGPDEDDEDDDFGFGEDDCGRWLNGKLSDQCRLAGTEDCDWECPIGYRGDR